MQHLLEKIFSETAINANEIALEIFNFQYTNNIIYKQYVDAIHCNIKEIKKITDIPFLPISFFKTHNVICAKNNYELHFKSSGTTDANTANHFVKNKYIYEQSFTNGFKQNYGDTNKYLILGLLPNYIEQGNSSLVYMVQHLIAQSKYPQSAMYLYNHEQLFKNLKWAKEQNVPTILFGVTYALLQFIENYTIDFSNLIIIETGGMKGRGPELTRTELHNKLQNAFNVQHIHSEYGMTELLSQAYSTKDEIFKPSNTMQVLVRDVYDPFDVKTQGKGTINILDFANIYSCSFIATQDQGSVFANGTFTITGRLDNSDMRGCNMLQ